MSPESELDQLLREVSPPVCPSTIVRQGVDVEQVSNVERANEVGGQRRRERLFTQAELDDFGEDIGRQAGRFAAKEAVAKSLGTGFRNGVAARHIEILTTASGPHVLLHGPARELADRARVFATTVSWSRSSGVVYATANSYSRPDRNDRPKSISEGTP